MKKVMAVTAAVAALLMGCSVDEKVSPVDQAAKECARFSADFTAEPGSVVIDSSSEYDTDSLAALVCVCALGGWAVGAVSAAGWTLSARCSRSWAPPGPSSRSWSGASRWR